MIDRRCRRGLVGLIGLIAVLGPGCKSRIDNAAVDADKARQTLRTALESWKKGEKVDALQAASPPIYVIDMEWQGGAVLRDFHIVNDGEQKDAHLFCPVKLTVRDKNGKEEQRQVTYIISTAPNLTVSRKVF